MTISWKNIFFVIILTFFFSMTILSHVKASNEPEQNCVCEELRKQTNLMRERNRILKRLSQER